MTIEKGKDWGERRDVPANTAIATSDAALADLFSAVRTESGEWAVSGPSLVALLPNGHTPRSPREATNGLAKTLGARGDRDSIVGAERFVVPIDLGVVTLNPDTADESTMVMASSLVIARPLWNGVTEAAMNAAFLDTWNVTPSGHPNDGRFDVVRAELGIADRLKARKRLPTGSHLPHPGISVRRLKAAEFRPGTSAATWIDGRRVGKVAHLNVTVIADAVSLAI